MKLWNVIGVLLLSVLMTAQSAVLAQSADPIAVARDYVAAVNAGDFDRAFAFYADGAVVKNPLGLFVGKDAISQWLQQDVQTTRSEPEQFQLVNGNTVVGTGMVSLARFQKLGIDTVQYRAEYLIEDGKIMFFSPTAILTPEQQAVVSAATPPPAAPAIDPVAVARDYVTAVNAGEFERAFAFYADGAVVKNPLGLFVGKDAISQWLQQDVQTTRSEPEQFQLVNGNTVVSTGMVSLARFQKLGIDTVQYRAEYLIEDGKIMFFSPMVTLTPEQQAVVNAAASPPAAPAASPPAAPAMLPQTGGTMINYGWLLWLAMIFIGSGATLIVRRKTHRM